MPETTRKLIDYTVVCVNEFARKKRSIQGPPFYTFTATRVLNF